MEPGNLEAHCIFSPAEQSVTKLVGSTHMPQKVKAEGGKTLSSCLVRRIKQD